MNTSSHPAGLYQSSTLNGSSSTLRPRAPRLISYVEDDSTTEATAVTTTSLSTPPRFSSRAVSPNISGSRARSTDDKREGDRTGIKHNISLSGSSKASTGAGKAGGGQGLWESWSSIQGLASTLLGDVPGSSNDKADKPFKTPIWMKQEKRYGSKPPPPKWGPSSEPPPATTATTAQAAIEERQALLQAKRREALLLASASESRDSSGRYKRRDSNAGVSSADPNTTSDSDADALVYLHKVQKEDTMAGVIIKYNCQAEAFRKANRFWPNDNIQTRSHVVIPLEGCTARGRKVDSPYLSKELFDSGFGLDQLSLQVAPEPSLSQAGSPSTVNGIHTLPQNNQTTGSGAPTNPSTLITSMSEETEFRHDSWVMLPNFKEAVEIVRVPRRALGYFPRPRRKSNATLTDASPSSTPKTSFDMLRHPPTHAAQTSASRNASPARRPGTVSRLSSASSSRQRSSSVTGGSFTEALRGPGGVGSLRGLRTEVARPGPADDPLNRRFAQYLPDLLPPPQEASTPPRQGGFGLRLPTPRVTTPRASTDSMRSTRSNSNGSGLGDVGGAIEGWVRKMAGGKRDRSTAVDKMGDLIELETANTEDGPEMLIAPGSTLASATEEALLNERFPLRGRVRTAYSRADSSTGKDKDA